MNFRQTYSLITVLFLLLAIAAMVVFFVMPEDRTWFYTLAGIAIATRIGQYIARFFYNRNLRKEKRKKLREQFPIEE